MSNKSVITAAGLDRLRRLVPEGTTVYTIYRHHSSSGMSHDISIVTVEDNGEPLVLDGAIIDLGLFPASRRRYGRGVRVTGAGMDMGFHVVHTLSNALYGNGYALRQRWL